MGRRFVRVIQQLRMWLSDSDRYQRGLAVLVQWTQSANRRNLASLGTEQTSLVLHL